MIYTGVDLLTISKVLVDSREEYRAETPEQIPVASIEIPEEGNYTIVYKDGEAINAYSIGSEQELTVETKAIDPAFLSGLLNGKEEAFFIDTGTSGTNFYAIGFRLKQYDGSYIYFSYPKCTISISSKSVETEQGTNGVIETIVFRPLTTIHRFKFNGKPCRKVEVNTKKHNVIESGWLSIVWTPDNFLPVPAPIIEATGTSENIEVTLMALRSGDTVRYTLDGTIPTLESDVYTEPIILTKATTVKAIECATCKHTSAVAVKEIKAKAPIIEIIANGETITAEIYSNTVGCKIYYTLDESEPNEESTLYNGAFAYNGETIKAKAYKGDLLYPSDITILDKDIVFIESYVGFDNDIIGF